MVGFFHIQQKKVFELAASSMKNKFLIEKSGSKKKQLEILK